MKPQEIKLFKDQPRICKYHLDDLRARGLIIDPARSKGRPSPGWVVGYQSLSDALKRNDVDQNDARRLLAIEVATTIGGARKTHVDRLMGAAFAEDRAGVAAKIESYREEC